MTCRRLGWVLAALGALGAASAEQARALTPLSNLAAAADSGQTGAVRLTWTWPDALASGASYYIEYSTNGGVSFSTADAQVVKTTGPVSIGASASAVVGGLDVGRDGSNADISPTYYFRVWTSSSGAYSTASNAASSKAKLPGLFTVILADTGNGWQSTLNSPNNGDDTGYAVAVDTQGNVYTSEYYSDPPGNLDSYLVKYSSAGTLLWMKYYNSPANANDWGEALSVDGSGNICQAGYETRTDLGQDRNIFVRKYDSGGALLWSATYDGAAHGDDQGKAIAADAAGNLYVAGEETVSGQGMNVWVRKYAPDGLVLWTTGYNNAAANSTDQGLGIALDTTTNSVYVTGYETVSGQGTNAWLRKLDSNGLTQWTTSYNAAANQNEQGYAASVDGAGNVYVAGYEYVSGQAENLWLRKFSSSGLVLWTTSYNDSASASDMAMGVAADPGGNVFVVGSEDRAGLGQALNILVQKYSASGLLQWTTTYNSPASQLDTAYGVALDAGGNAYVSGRETRGDLGQGSNVWVRRYNANLYTAQGAGFTAPSGCGSVKNVKKDGTGDYTTIQAAVGSLPTTLSTTTCVVVRDTQTYAEQVTVQGFTNNGWQLKILADPSFVSSRPVISPPSLSTAAFLLKNASVTLQGLAVYAAGSVAYGVSASSAYADLSGLVVEGGTRIWTAAIALSSSSTLSNSSVTASSAACNPGSHRALYIDGSWNTVTLSTLAGSSYLAGGSSNTLSNSFLINTSSCSKTLEFSGAAYSALTQSFVSNSYDAMVIGNYAHHNSVSDSTLTVTIAPVGYIALQLGYTSSNTVTRSSLSSPYGYALALGLNANSNQISQSTLSVNQTGTMAAYILAAANNTITQCLLSNPAGKALRLYSGASFNQVSQSTMTGNSIQDGTLFVDGSSSNTFLNNYIQGTDAVHLKGSTNTIIGASVIASTATMAQAIYISNGGYGFSLSSSTLLVGSAGAGVYMEAGLKGLVALGSNTVQGATYGLRLSSMAAGGTLAASDLAFNGLAAGATAIDFLSGTFVSTFSGMSFASTNIFVNVNGLLLASGSRITMQSSTGTKAGPLYENDPNGYVDWPGYASVFPAPSGCGLTKNVKKDGTGDYTTLQAAVGSLPTTLSTTTCVVVRDTQTYAEQVTVQGFTNNGWQLKIMSDPSFVSSRPVVSPPSLSTAAFLIKNASVSLQGFVVSPSSSLSYGVITSSRNTALTGLIIGDSDGRIAIAGIALSSWSSLSQTSLTLVNAHGLYLNGVLGASIEASTVQVSASDCYALYLLNSSSNSIAALSMSNSAGVGVRLKGGGSNSIAFSTVDVGGPWDAIVMNQTSSNLLDSSIVRSASGRGVFFDFAYNNMILRSTITVYATSALPGVAAVFIQYSSSNTISESYLFTDYGGAFSIMDSDYHTITLSTAVARFNSYSSFAISGGNNITVTRSRVLSEGGGGVHLGGGTHGNLIDLCDIDVWNNALDISSLGAYDNTITRSFLSSKFAKALSIGLGDSHHNTISLSTITGNNSSVYTAYLDRTSSTTIVGSYIQSPSYALTVTDSTGVVIQSNDLVATASDGIALLVNNINLGLSVSSNTLTGGVLGSGIRLNMLNESSISLSSNTIRNARYGLLVGTPAASVALSISDLRLHDLALGATAIQFLGGALVSTFSGVDFADTTIAVNVNASLLGAGSRVTMWASTGTKAGPLYENDPNGYVDWPGYASVFPAPSGCGLTKNVKKDGTGDFTTIQAAVGSLPTTLSTTTCVVVRDTQTYAEQVTVQGFTNNGWQLKIMSDPSFVSSRPVVSPPAASTAAFRVLNASVTLAGVDVLVSGTASYGVWVSSNDAALAKMTVTASSAHGLYLSNAARASVSSSSFYADNTASYAVYLTQSSSNSFVVVLASNSYGPGMVLESGSGQNTVSLSTMAGSHAGAAMFALKVDNSQGNVFSDCYIRNSLGRGAMLQSSANYNSIIRSTLSTSLEPLQILQSSSNTVQQVLLYSSGSVIMQNAHFNAIGYSTITTSVGGSALALSYSSGNTLTYLYIQNTASGGLSLGTNAVYTTVSHSTLSINTQSSYAAYLNGSSSNTLSETYISNQVGTALFLMHTGYNTITMSTAVAGANGYAAHLDDSRYDLLTRSRFTGTGLGGVAVQRSDHATLSLSTVAATGAASRGLSVLNSTSTWVLDSYVQGSTGAMVCSSTLTAISSSTLAASTASASALWFSTANVGLALIGDVFVGGRQGVYLESYPAGALAISSGTVKGGRYGLVLSTPALGMTLAMDAMSFASLQAGATAVQFLGGVVVSTFTGTDFSDLSLGVNVNGSLLGAGSRVTMWASTGTKAGPSYENDPNGYVDWPGNASVFPAPSGCGLTKNVKKDGTGDYTTLQAAVGSLPTTLSTTTCVVVRDTQTYAEQVSVQGFTNNGYRLKLMADPSFISSAPVVSPPALSTAAFFIKNASVSVQGFAVASTSPFSYGVYASSAYLSADKIGISGNLGFAGVYASSWSSVASATVTANDAHGFIVVGQGSLLSGSRANVSSPARYALWINGASSSTFAGVIASNTAGIALEMNGDSRWNLVQQSTLAGDTAGLYALYVSSGYANVFSDCYIRNSTGNAAVMGWWSSGNTLLRSTVVATAPQTSALTLMSPSNLLQDSVFRSASGSGLILSGAHLNTILRSTVTTDSAANDALYVSGSDSNTITESYIQNLSGDALSLTASRNDTVTLSTAIGGPEGYFALYLTSGSSHVITRNRILSPTGGGIRIVSGSYGNLIGLCDVRAWADALDINAGSSNTINRDFLRGVAGYALSIQGGSPYNVVSQSTMTGGSSYTVQLVILSSSTIEDSYIEGSSPIILYHSTGVAIRSSVIVATSAAGTALWTNLGNQGLVVSSNVLVAGPQGSGFRLDMQTPSSILLSSNTVRGARYGVHVGTPVAGDSLSIDGLVLEALAPGATAIQLVSGILVSTFNGVAFNDPALAVNVAANLLYPGSRITLAVPSGPKAGPAYENDPGGYVDWPGFDTAPPIVAVLTPSSGSVIDAHTVVTGTAYDQSGVGRVELRFSRLSDGFYWDFGSSVWTAAPATTTVALALGTSSWSFVPPQALRDAFFPGSDYAVAARGVDLAAPANAGAFQPIPFTFVDGIAPSSSSVTAAYAGVPGSVRLDWLCAGDDGGSGILPSGSRFYVQRATFTALDWSTAAAQLALSTSGVSPGQPVSLVLSGLNGGTTYWFRVWTQDTAGNVSAPSALAPVFLPLLADRLAVAAPGEAFSDGSGRTGVPNPQLTYNPFPVRVYAVEPSSRVVTGAAGWVRLVVIDDPDAVVSPSSAPLVNGQASFTLTLTVPQLARIQAEALAPLALLRDVTQVTSLSGTNLLVEPASIAPNTAQQGAGAVGLLRLSLRTNAGTLWLSGLGLQVAGGTRAPAGVFAYWDSDGNGLLDANADIRLTSSPVAETVALGFSPVPVSSAPRTLFLAVSIASDAVVGSSFSLIVPATASFVLSGGSAAAQAVYPIQSGSVQVGAPSGTIDDAAPPLSAILSPAPGSTPPDLALILGTAADNVAVDRVLVGVQRPSDGKWWNGASWVYVSAPVLSTASYVLPEWTLTNGPSSSSLTAGQTYRILSWAVDTAGNWQSTAALSQVVISSSAEPLDRVPPLSRILYPVSGSVLSSLGTLSGTAYDETSLAKVETALLDEARGLWWNGAGWSAGAMVLNAAQLGNGFWSWALPAASSFLTDGSSYTVLSRAADAAGNLQSPFASSSFTYQAAVTVSTPAALITLPQPGALVTTLAQVSGTASNAPAQVRVWIRHPATGRWWKGSSQEWVGVSTINYAALSGAYWSFASGPSSGSLVANSSYTIQAEARNSAGTLVQTPPASVTVFTSTSSGPPQDVQPPVSAILAPAPGASSLVSLGVVSGTALDNSKVTQVFLGVRRESDGRWWGEGAGWMSAQVLNPVSLSSPSAPFTAWSYSALPDSFLTVGSSYTLLAWAKDGANNIQAAPAERAFTFATVVVVDTTPPAAVTDLAAVSTAPSQVELRWTAPGDDGWVGRAAGYLLRMSTSGPLTSGGFSAAQALAAPLPAPAGTPEVLVVYGLEPGKTVWFAVRGKDEAGNLSPYFNSASADVRKAVVAGDGSGAAVWSPANAPSCALITATMTFTNGTHTFQAGGLAAFQLPEGWPEPQLACSTCQAFVRVLSTSLASLEPTLLKDFGPRWAGALVTSGQLLGGEVVRIAVDRVQAPPDLRTGASLPARSRASFGGEARSLSVLPTLNQVAGPAAAIRLADAAALSLGPGQVSPPIFLEGLDACGRYRSAPAAPREFTLWASAGGELSLSPAFTAPASSMTVVLSSAASPPVYFRSALSGARTLDVAYVDLEQSSVLRRLSRGVNVLGSVIGFMPGSVGVSTGANLPGRTFALITPDGDMNADGAYLLFTPSLSSVSWRVVVSSAADFGAAWRQYAGTGDPGRSVYFDGKDASGRIRPGPYYVRLELNGGVAVDTATIALTVSAAGIAGKVKVGADAVANAKVAISGPGASREERSEADGSYAFYGLRTGSTYFLSAEYYNTTTGETARTTAAVAAPAVSPAADLSLLLAGRLRVSARIERPAGSDLYGEARLRDLASARPASARLRFAAGAMASDDGGAALSTWTLFTVLPDTYVVTLTLPGYETQTATVTLAAGSALDLLRTMTRKADLYGRFELPELQEYGTAVAVEARRSTDSAPAQTAMLYLPGLKDEGRTPALSGVFALTGLEPGAYTLTARAIGFEPVSAGPYTVGWEDLGNPDSPLALLPVAGYGGVIQGSVSVQGDTLSKGAFTLTLSALNQRTGAASFSKAAFSPSAALSSATYRITGLGAGSYRVVTALEGFELASATMPATLSAGGAAVKDLLLRQYAGQVRALLTLPAGYADYGSVALVLKSSTTEITGTAASAAWLSPATLATARWTLSARYARTGAVASRTVDVVSGASSDAALDLSGQTQSVSGTVSLSGSVSLSLGTYTFTAAGASDLAAASALSSFCSRAYGGCVSTTSFRLELYSLDDASRADGLFAPINSDGRYRFENVPSGAYVLLNATELDGSASDGAEVSSSWQVLWVASSPVSADMSLLAGKEVRGRFLLPSGIAATRLFTVSLLDRTGASVQSQNVSLQDASEGSYALPRIADGSYLLLVQDAEAPRRYVAAPRAVTVSGADAEVADIPLALMGAITGSLRLKQLVYGSTSSLITPITPLNAALLPEGLQVTALADPWVEGGYASAERSQGRLLLDENGRFSVTGLVPGKYRLRFEQSGNSDALGQGGYNLAPAELSGVEVAEGQSKDVGAVDLPVAQTVQGTVRSPDGSLLANVPVSAEAVNADHRVSALTDAAGRFVLVGLDPALRYYDIAAMSREGEEESDAPRPAYGEARLSGVDVLTRYANLDLTLTRADADLTCTVSGTDGRPLSSPHPVYGTRPGAKIHFLRGDAVPRANPNGDLAVFTAADGTLRVRSLVPGSYTLTAFALDRKRASRSVRLLSGANASCALGMEPEEVSLSGVLTHFDGSSPSRGEVEQIVAASADGSERLYAELVKPGNSQVVTHYALSGLRVGTLYQLLIYDADGDVYAPPEAAALRFDSAGEQRLNLHVKPVRPSVSASVVKLGERLFSLEFTATKPLRKRAVSDDDAASLVSASTGTLAGAGISPNRKTLSVTLDAAAVSAASATVRFRAFSNVVDPESADPLNPELAMETTAYVFIGVDSAMETPVNSQKGGQARAGGDDPSNVTLPAGALDVAASSVVVVGVQKANANAPGQQRAQGGSLLRYSAASYPAPFFKALAAAPPGIRPLSAFYDIFLPLGVRTQLRKPAELVIKYDTMTVTDPTRLNLYWFNEAANAYVLQQDALGLAPQIDYVNHTVKVRVTHFSTFVLINSQQVVISDQGNFSGGELEAFNYPNPFSLDEKTVDLTQAAVSKVVRGTMIRVGVPRGAAGTGRIHIFNVAGERVRSLEFTAGTSGRYNYIEWDGRNDSGRDVASGVYIGEVKLGGDKAFFKMGLIR